MTVFLERFDMGGDGLSVAVKDCIDIAGLVTTAGSAVLSQAQPALEHAEVVKNLLAANCRLLGKTNMHEFAYGMTGVNHWSGTPVNHFFPDFITGGSSSGSAVAVAQEAVDFALGTDTGGSIRLPAACCGVFGLKPTYGRVSRQGLIPASSSLDCVGPFAGTAEMITAAMTIIDPSFKPLAQASNIRYGLVAVAVDAQVESVFNDAMDKVPGEKPMVGLPLMGAAFEAGMTIINNETWQTFGRYIDSAELGADVKLRLGQAKETSAEQVEEAERVRKNFSEQVDAVLENFDVLMMPTLPSLPMSRADALAGAIDIKLSRLVRPFNLSGHPAISLPIKNNLDLPVAMQLVAAKGKDELLCYVAEQVSILINSNK